ncbi:MAG: hypothetical protein QNK37_37355, partial [Acidobacteriota bacterium]|nr:hypothetical protein [Acidobacteriota bacterium]
MTLLLLYAILFHEGHEHVKPEVTFSDTRVWQPFSRNDVAVSPQGAVYVVNFQTAKIIHYGKHGKKLGTYGRKGKGPGEYVYPTQIFLQGDRVYVKDMGAGRVS